MLKNIRLGLIRYWLKAGLEDKISITIKRSKPADLVEEVDPWNNWIFSIGASGNFNGHETYSKRNLNFNASARRITDKNITLYNVFSLNSHWSVGFFSYFGGSDYSNKDLYANVSPAIEYNFFNYKESFKKQLTIAYRVGGVYNDYIEKTVFGKDNEFLWNHSLSFKS